MNPEGQVLKTAFVKSSRDVKACPKPLLPEYAFLGRSNVGKSSLINMLTGVKGLAKISGTPGKTQLINHFLINDNWYLVDLPGYGFARISKGKRDEWEKMIKKYLLSRLNLMCSFILLDTRLELQELDRQLINWFGENGLPFVLLFTKTDKLSKRQLEMSMNNYKKQLLLEWEELPQYVITSSLTALGREDIMNIIQESNKLFEIPRANN